MRRGEIYRSDVPQAERGHKPGYYVVVGRGFIAENERIATVICAPVYSEMLGIPTEIAIDKTHGVEHPSAIRCDFLMLMFKQRLTRYVAMLPDVKIAELDKALARALELPIPTQNLR
jgi:mRNA interferase MazF